MDENDLYMNIFGVITAAFLFTDIALSYYFNNTDSGNNTGLTGAIGPLADAWNL